MGFFIFIDYLIGLIVLIRIHASWWAWSIYIVSVLVWLVIGVLSVGGSGGKTTDAKKRATMKVKFGEIMLYVLIGVMIVVAIVGGLFVEFWKWLKDLSPKKKPVEEAEEKTSEFEFHCHDCGEHFMVGGMVLDNGLESKIFAFSKKCPYCGSPKLGPVMFEDDESLPWLKTSWL